MNREEVKDLINLISEEELAVINSPNFKRITEETLVLSAMGIDSLEYMMLYMHLGDLFGIDKEAFKNLEVLGDVQLRTAVDFLLQWDTRRLSYGEAFDEFFEDR
jgi:acyl carrier protein